MATELKQLKHKLEELASPVLTIYLQTDPTNENWKILLKNGLKRIEEYVQLSQREQTKLYAKIRAKVELAIADHQRNLKQGLICFASSTKLLLKQTQFPVENEFYWENKPITKQLNNLLKKYPKMGIILLQRSKVAIIDTLLGDYLNETHYEFDVNTEHWRRYKGIAFGAIISSSANHRDKFDRRMKEHQARWFKNLVPTIEKHGKDECWTGVYLAGPPELTNEMQQFLNIPILKVITRNYADQTAYEIIEKFIMDDVP